MIKLLIVGLVLLSSCSKKNKYPTEDDSKYGVGRTRINRFIDRIENEEVVCYINMYNGGLDCKWKVKNNERNNKE